MTIQPLGYRPKSVEVVREYMGVVSQQIDLRLERNNPLRAADIFVESLRTLKRHQHRSQVGELTERGEQWFGDGNRQRWPLIVQLEINLVLATQLGSPNLARKEALGLADEFRRRSQTYLCLKFSTIGLMLESHRIERLGVDGETGAVDLDGTSEFENHIRWALQRKGMTRRGIREHISKLSQIFENGRDIGEELRILREMDERLFGAEAFLRQLAFGLKALGDQYSRKGEHEKAAQYYRRRGDLNELRVQAIREPYRQAHRELVDLQDFCKN